MKKKIFVVSTYAICHFIIDFLCALFIVNLLGNLNSAHNYWIAILLYNFFAFAFQVPLGIVIDKLKIKNYIGISGIALISLVFLLCFENIILNAIILGIGNALFHLEGGINIYQISDKKCALNGIFVSSGAIGIFLGMNLKLAIIWLPFFLIIVAIIMLFVVSEFVQENCKIKKDSKYNKKHVALIVLLIGISIIVRSIVGTVLVYDWKITFAQGLIFAIGIVFGKFLGGIFADKFGINKIINISFILSGILLLLGYNYNFCGYLGILLFNLPMAITLTMLENVLENKVGLAVGLNTMFLFIGFLIKYLDIKTKNELIILANILVAIITTNITLRIYNKLIKFQNIKNEEEKLALQERTST